MKVNVWIYVREGWNISICVREGKVGMLVVFTSSLALRVLFVNVNKVFTNVGVNLDSKLANFTFAKCFN